MTTARVLSSKERAKKELELVKIEENLMASLHTSSERKQYFFKAASETEEFGRKASQDTLVLDQQQRQLVSNLYSESADICRQIANFVTIIFERDIRIIECSRAVKEAEKYLTVFDLHDELHINELFTSLDRQAVTQFALSKGATQYLTLGKQLLEKVLHLKKITEVMDAVIEKADAHLPDAYQAKQRIDAFAKKLDDISKTEVDKGFRSNPCFLGWISRLQKGDVGLIKQFISSWTTDGRTPSLRYQEPYCYEEVKAVLPVIQSQQEGFQHLEEIMQFLQSIRDQEIARLQQTKAQSHTPSRPTSPTLNPPSSAKLFTQSNTPPCKPKATPKQHHSTCMIL